MAAQGGPITRRATGPHPNPTKGTTNRNTTARIGQAPYLALGPGAHGFLDSTRYANVSNNPRYIQAIQQGALLDERNPHARDRYNELVMTGLRTAQGISPEQLHGATGVRPQEVDAEAWTQALDGGRPVEHQPGWFRIPEPTGSLAIRSRRRCSPWIESGRATTNPKTPRPTPRPPRGRTPAEPFTKNPPRQDDGVQRL